MAKPTRAAKKRLTTKQKWLRALKWASIGVLSLVLLGVGTFAVAYMTMPVPDPNKDFTTNNTTLYFRDGTTELGSLTVQNRVSIPYAEMPKTATDAAVALENRTFWTDPGVSIPGIARAVLGIVTRSSDTGGGSTITQQYIKVLYLTQEKTLMRKFKEIVLAAKVGADVPKEQILEGYLNTVYYGRGAYGIQAAAKTFFGIDAKDMNLAQSVALTAMINDPGRLDPNRGAKNAAALLERYQFGLNGMLEMGKVSQAEHDAIYTALPDFPKIASSNSRLGGPKGFLIQAVADELKADGFTDAQINGGGLKVTTTFDSTMQEAAVAAAQKVTLQAAKNDATKAANLHAGLASVDATNGEVLAMYGGPDYVANSRNWATTDRHTGSTFKPYALAAALRAGRTLNDMLNGNTFTPKGDGKPVTNAGGANFGPVTLLKATTSSINTAYVDLVSQMSNGPTKVMQAAMDAGLTKSTDWENNNRLPLGTAQASPLDMASAYATFDNGGKQIPPHVVSKVVDLQGTVVYQAAFAATQKIEPSVAQDVTYALTKVAEDGTGRAAAQLTQPVAGKTGTFYTANTTLAAWFVGYTKQISTAAMFVAGDDGEGNLDQYAPGGFYGSGYPSQLWLAYMKVAMQGQPSLSFDPPTSRQSTATPTEDATTAAATKAPATSAAPTPSAATSSAAPASTTPAPATTTAAPEPSSSATSSKGQQARPSTSP